MPHIMLCRCLYTKYFKWQKSESQISELVESQGFLGWMSYDGVNYIRWWFPGGVNMNNAWLNSRCK